MDVIVILFIMLSSVFAILMLALIGIDMLEERLEKKAALAVGDAVGDEPCVAEAEAEQQAPEPEILPEVTLPVVFEEMPSAVTQIDAIEADALLSDDLAIQNASYEKGAKQGKLGIVNLGDIDKQFVAHDTVTLAALQEKGMLTKKTQRLKILADGILSKPLTVKAEGFSVQAMKMIELTGGTVVVLKG